ncbi:MAG: hypothetical protein K8R58_03830 [Bacteroidales bacterium]|nr:hypothetical protein [Bacteroidales bacterium]
MSTRKQKSQNNYCRPNLWGMIRDIGVASLNKGQFPLALFGTIIIILMLKLSSDDASKLIFKIVTLFKSMHLVGWILSFVFVIGWYMNTRKLRRLHTSEMRRIAQEKKKLQEILIGKKLKTSN